MACYRILLVLVGLPYLVSCLVLVSEDDCWQAYRRTCMIFRRKHRRHRGGYDPWGSRDESSEVIIKKKCRVSATTPAPKEENWVVLPMNGLGVPNYGDDDLNIADNALNFDQISRQLLQGLRRHMISAGNINPSIETPSEEEQICPFSETLDCDETYPYRNPDGSCNNLQFPYHGKSSTPFERYIPADYSDGINAPRMSVAQDLDLPSARIISTEFHGCSTSDDCQDKLVHLTALFGIFLGHDLFDYQTFPILKGAAQEQTDCCTSGLSETCYPIKIPEDDYHFCEYNRTCMAFRRSLPSPQLTCHIGPRNQMNRATSFLDASQIYGSDLKSQLELRTMTGGLMRTTSTEYMDLLPQTETYCSSKVGNLCFLGGDGRVNLHPLITAQHNLFIREHNRLANLLGATYPNWSDETLFQEARKFLISEIQHITMNEFLPLIIGPDLMEKYNICTLPEGHSTYLEGIHPATRNSFASAAFLFSHSGINEEITLNGTLIPFGSLFYNPDIFYNVTDATTLLYEGLTTDIQQKIDRLMSDELSNKLMEQEPGTGWDLSALNIQSGRDNGLPPYNVWRQWCGLRVPENFTCLYDHIYEDRVILQHLYESVDDIDLWSGGISEVHVSGGSVGPTFACIIARQFQALKFGDRFWYESRGANQIPIDALNAIRNVSMSRLICDNTDLDQIQISAFTRVSYNNPVVPCSEIPMVDECALVRTYGEWSAWSTCVDNRRARTRVAIAPIEEHSLHEDIQPDTQIDACVSPK